MLDKLNGEFFFQKNVLDLLDRRQNILASNIANADTPGYQARDISFKDELFRMVSKKSFKNKNLNLFLTSKKHIQITNSTLRTNNNLLYRIPDQSSADGNTVNMDRERLNFVENNLKYQAALSFINAQVKNMMSVLSNRG